MHLISNPECCLLTGHVSSQSWDVIWRGKMTIINDWYWQKPYCTQQRGWIRSGVTRELATFNKIIYLFRIPRGDSVWSHSLWCHQIGDELWAKFRGLQSDTRLKLPVVSESVQLLLGINQFRVNKAKNKVYLEFLFLQIALLSYNPINNRTSAR